MTTLPIPSEADRIADAILSVMANHPQASAAAVAFLASWVLYGVLGKRALGADDDYWERIRTIAIPLMDRFARDFPGFYAEADVTNAELVGIVPQGEEAFEQTLMDLGYTRNPLASLKTNPQGWTEDGSWAKRYAGPRWIGDGLRAWADRRTIPGPGFIAGMLGRFIQGLGDILAFRQVHVTIFDDPDADAVWVYAHDEPNSLNPVTAWAHYRAVTFKKAKGVRTVRDTLTDADVQFTVPADAAVQ